jgi:methyl-accepting chemotaxis protein
MIKTKEPIQTVPKSYLSGFVRASTLIFAAGALLTAAGFYFAPEERLVSYADSFKLIAELNRVLVTKSLILFSFTLLLMVAGVVVISVAYSHRVAGPLFKLGMHTRKIASGDLAEEVRLRKGDVIHALAGDMNSLSSHYRGLLAQLEIKTRELAAVVDKPGRHAPPRNDADPSGEISERIDEIKELLNQIRL